MNRCPKRLSGEAKAKWQLIAPTLEDLNAMELEALTQYVEQYALYIRAANEIAASEKLSRMAKNDADCPIAPVAIQNKAMDQMRRLYQLLNKKFKNVTQDEEFDV